MAYTTHGHHIDGTDVTPPPQFIAKCGGIFMCPVCRVEARPHAVPQGRYRPPPLNGNDATAILAIIADWMQDTGEEPSGLLKDLKAAGYTPVNKNRP